MTPQLRYGLSLPSQNNSDQDARRHPPSYAPGPDTQAALADLAGVTSLADFARLKGYMSQAEDRRLNGITRGIEQAWRGSGKP